jgi:hypothetical protein
LDGEVEESGGVAVDFGILRKVRLLLRRRLDDIDVDVD